MGENIISTKLFSERTDCKREKVNLTLFLSGKMVSLLGTFAYSLAISWYILKVTGSATTFAISVLMSTVPRVVFGPIAGSIADRFDRKKLTVWLDILSGITVLSLLGISSVFGLKIPFIYMTSFMLAIINTLFDMTITASLPNLVTDKNLMKINSYSQAITSLAGIMGPVLGGVIYGLVPIKLFLLINGLSFIASAISEMFIDFKFNKPKDEDENVQEVTTREKIGFKSTIKDIKEVVGFLKEKKALFTLLKFALGFNLLLQPTLSVVLPYIINNVLKMKSFQFGVIEAAWGIGILITSIIIGGIKEGKSKLKSLIFGTTTLGILVVAIGIPAIPYFRSFSINVFFIYYALIMIIVGVVMVIVNTPLMVYIQRTSPDKIRGRVIGVLMTMAGGIAPLGIVAAGVLIDLTPPFVIPIASGTIIIMLALIMGRSKSMKDY